MLCEVNFLAMQKNSSGAWPAWPACPMRLALLRAPSSYPEHPIRELELCLFVALRREQGLFVALSREVSDWRQARSGPAGRPEFFVRKQFWKIDFWIIFFFDFLYMASISSINHHFLLSSSWPSTALKIESGIPKSTWGLTYSSFGPPGTWFSPDFPPEVMVLSPKLTLFELIRF